MLPSHLLPTSDFYTLINQKGEKKQLEASCILPGSLHSLFSSALSNRDLMTSEGGDSLSGD